MTICSVHSYGTLAGWDKMAAPSQHLYITCVISLDVLVK